MNKLIDNLEAEYRKKNETNLPTDDSGRRVISNVDSLNNEVNGDNLLRHKEICKSYLEEARLR